MTYLYELAFEGAPDTPFTKDVKTQVIDLFLNSFKHSLIPEKK